MRASVSMLAANIDISFHSYSLLLTHAIQHDKYFNCYLRTIIFVDGA